MRKRQKLWVAESRKSFIEVMIEMPSNKGHCNHKGSGISSSGFFKDFSPSVIFVFLPPYTATAGQSGVKVGLR